MVEAGILKERSKVKSRDGRALWNNSKHGLSGVICFVTFVVATQCPASEGMEKGGKRVIQIRDSAYRSLYIEALLLSGNFQMTLPPQAIQA